MNEPLQKKPVKPHDRRAGSLGRLGRNSGRRILQSTAVLPGLATILNGLTGFAAIHYATKDALGEVNLGNLVISAWLIFGAMVFDMLDGRLARMTRRSSDFGGQLDSLCDVISFGVAPAVLMLRTVVGAMRGQIELISSLPNDINAERVVWCIAALYMACAVLRLARFNVENDPDESRHVDFRGLPTPAAAATIAALVLLLTWLSDLGDSVRSSGWLMTTVSLTLPPAALITALLMVSRFSYPHLVNQYIHGKRPFGYLVKIVALLLVGLWKPFIVAVVLTIAYALSGPVRWAWQKLRPRTAAQG
ncbi:MAG: CDP-diacylglycerol--serine O-phosphatidyltransferase [Planctomycetota bacterium]|nr:CDP-diacylglycerol--serine O-phosphatidyltransferase [Planctomycetota bacterium]